MTTQRDAALASGLFITRAASHPESVPLQPDRCAGYQVPLFLGGKDEAENLEECDL